MMMNKENIIDVNGKPAIIIYKMDKEALKRLEIQLYDEKYIYDSGITFGKIPDGNYLVMVHCYLPNYD